MYRYRASNFFSSSASVRETQQRWGKVCHNYPMPAGMAKIRMSWFSYLLVITITLLADLTSHIDDGLSVFRDKFFLKKFNKYCQPFLHLQFNQTYFSSIKYERSDKKKSPDLERIKTDPTGSRSAKLITMGTLLQMLGKIRLYGYDIIFVLLLLQPCRVHHLHLLQSQQPGPQR